MKKRFLFAAVAALTLLAACSSGANNSQSSEAKKEETTAVSEEKKETSEAKKSDSDKPVTLKVGASPSPHAEILEAAKKALDKEGIKLEIVVFNDYVLPNKATESGEIDANYFQHLPYLEQFNEENGTDIVSAGAIHYEPFGIYKGKTESLEDLKDGASVAVPNDVTNEARALLLLADKGLLKLKDGVGLEATKNDIVENPKNLDIKEIEAAQIPRSIKDVDIAVINGNFAIDAGFKVKDALATEDADSVAAVTYANIIAVKSGRENEEAIKALVNVLQSDEIKEFINSKYEGAVVPSDN
jgi:D-methionine-binding lipoprotein metQ